MKNSEKFFFLKLIFMTKLFSRSKIEQSQKVLIILTTNYGR